MVYQEFKQHIIHTLQKELGNNTKIDISDIIKNNGIHLDGLTILSEASNCSPTIYLNHYFEQFAHGRPLPKICQEILKVCRETLPCSNIDVSFFTDYDRMKSNLICKLIHYEKNKELLSDIPHFRFLDLAIVFCCLMQSDFPGNGTILIKKSHLDFWNITPDDLYAHALKNTPLLLPQHLFGISDILSELCTIQNMDLSDIEKEASNNCPMFILTNTSRVNGAVCMLYPNLLAKIAKHFGSDLFILPSSIHEVILIPADKKTTCEDLSRMVREVNGSQLAPEEILSDHAYYFCMESGKITM